METGRRDPAPWEIGRAAPGRRLPVRRVGDGITVNGLVILNEDQTLDRYFESDLIGAPAHSSRAPTTMTVISMPFAASRCARPTISFPDAGAPDPVYPFCHAS